VTICETFHFSNMLCWLDRLQPANSGPFCLSTRPLSYTTGIVFKPNTSTPVEREIVRLAFGDHFEPVPAAEVSTENDIRLSGNLAFEWTSGVSFIYSGEAVQKFLFEGESPSPSFFEALGNPSKVIFFCHYDSGDSFGYRIFENGVPTRRRLYTVSGTIDEGLPKAFEHAWLNAEKFVEDEDEPPAYRNPETGEVRSEGYITAAMLRLALTRDYGICPWDEWDYKTNFNYYKAKKAADTSQTQARQSWWRKLW
jgi:hypothetical protein